MIGSDSDLVVSTYPLATQLLGSLKRRGRITTPVVTYLTDPSVHPLWLTSGVELYLASHPATLEQLKDSVGAPVVLVAPAVRSEFRPASGPEERRRGRAEFGLPPGPLALVASGAWAVGDIEQTAREIAATGVATPVVCGDNTTLRTRLADPFPGVALGWVTDMPTLMRAVDVAVFNSGGMTWAEAYTSALPTLHYRPLAGHGRANAAVLAQAGQAPWVRHPSDLAAALRRALTTGPPHPEMAPITGLHDPATLITALAAGTGTPTLPNPGLAAGRRWRAAA